MKLCVRVRACTYLSCLTFIRLSICLFIYHRSTTLFNYIDRQIYLIVYRFLCLNLSFHLQIYISSIYLSIHPFRYFFIHKFIYSSVQLSSNPSTHPLIYPWLCLRVHPSIRLPSASLPMQRPVSSSCKLGDYSCLASQHTPNLHQ